jgi:hypothetical protein
MDLPEAQLPLAVPPLEVHSLVVKQVPCTVFAAVDDEATHRLQESNLFMRGKCPFTI